MTVRERPAGRYGSSRPRKRRGPTYWILLSAFMLAGVVVAVVAYRNLGNSPIDVQPASYRVLNDSMVTFSFTVDRDQPGQAVDCIVYALASNGSEVARREVYVPPSETTVQVNTTLHTAKRATTVEAYGCSYQVPSYLAKSVPPSG